MSVLVYINNSYSELGKVQFSLISYAKQIAEYNKLQLILCLHQSEDVKSFDFGLYGCNKTIALTHSDMCELNTIKLALSDIIIRENSKFILFENISTSQNLAARLSVIHKAAVLTGITSLPLSYSPLIIQKSIFSSKLLASYKLSNSINFFCVKTDFKINDTYNINSENIEYNLVSEQNVDMKIEAKDTRINLSDANFVLSGGRGMQSKDNWYMIDDLAELIGAAKACSRPISDLGWRPEEEHVGQTGKFISPDCYVAIGISGATQHIAGVSSSKTIISINIDEKAPIFEYSDYGIVADALELLPEIINKLNSK
ncbi:MAG: electron transfer flavoprotein subunit alpha/FixB family protein [Marinifilaceae bacterium]|jgi:electron transfer flavoprotein alpha subunit|nr:electron transfer flavoprotein subunit alpha/FixB family protein [Marinifilaceae bacterium]